MEVFSFGNDTLSRQARSSLGASASCAARVGGDIVVVPRLRPAALSGVNCTACVSPLRGLEMVSVSVSPSLTCGVIKMSPLRGFANWDFCPDDACGGRADGWGVRDCAVALTVGKDLLVTFPSLETLDLRFQKKKLQQV